MAQKFTKAFFRGVNLAKLYAARNALGGMFIWSESPQGFTAWSNVRDALDEILSATEKYRARKKAKK